MQRRINQTRLLNDSDLENTLRHYSIGHIKTTRPAYGLNTAPNTARKKDVVAFLKKKNVPADVIDVMVKATTFNSVMLGCHCAPGLVLKRFSANAEPGRYFTHLDSASPSRLGLGGLALDRYGFLTERREHYYVSLEDTTALLSLSKSINDDFSIPGVNQRSEGGDGQLLVLTGHESLRCIDGTAFLIGRKYEEVHRSANELFIIGVNLAFMCLVDSELRAQFPSLTIEKDNFLGMDTKKLLEIILQIKDFSLFNYLASTTITIKGRDDDEIVISSNDDGTLKKLYTLLDEMPLMDPLNQPNIIATIKTAIRQKLKESSDIATYVVYTNKIIEDCFKMFKATAELARLQQAICQNLSNAIIDSFQNNPSIATEEDNYIRLLANIIDDSLVGEKKQVMITALTKARLTATMQSATSEANMWQVTDIASAEKARSALLDYCENNTTLEYEAMLKIAISSHGKISDAVAFCSALNQVAVELFEYKPVQTGKRYNAKDTPAFGKEPDDIEALQRRLPGFALTGNDKLERSFGKTLIHFIQNSIESALIPYAEECDIEAFEDYIAITNANYKKAICAFGGVDFRAYNLSATIVQVLFAQYAVEFHEVNLKEARTYVDAGIKKACEYTVEFIDKALAKENSKLTQKEDIEHATELRKKLYVKMQELTKKFQIECSELLPQLFSLAESDLLASELKAAIGKDNLSSAPSATMWKGAETYTSGDSSSKKRLEF